MEISPGSTNPGTTRLPAYRSVAGAAQATYIVYSARCCTPIRLSAPPQMLPDNSTIIDPVGPPHTPPDTPADPQRCKLLGTTGLVVQALSKLPSLPHCSPTTHTAHPPVGVLVIASLVIKKQLEKRKRSWRIWFLDVSKQLVGQAVVHALNLLVRCVFDTAPSAIQLMQECRYQTW